MELRGPVKVVKKRRQLHQSGVNMINRCATQFEYRYVRGLRRPPSAFMLCGTGVDRGVNYDLDTKILSGELAKLDEITALAAETVEKDERADSIKLDPEDAGKSVKQVVSETKDRAVRLVTLHHGEVAPDIRPWRTARKFTVNLDKFLYARAKSIREEAESEDLSDWRRRVMRSQAAALWNAAREGLDFVGEQDIVEKFQDAGRPEILNIRDTKTSGKRKNQDQVDSDDQLTAYACSAMVIDGRLPDDLMFDVLVETPALQKHSTQTIHTKRTETDVDVYLNRIANAVASIQMGSFPPTNQSSWWCDKRYCGYTNICPYFRNTERPGTPLVEIGSDAGKAEDLLPILNKSVVLAKKDEGDE